MQQTVLTDEFGCSVYNLNLYGAIIDGQNTGACCDAEHHDTDGHKGYHQWLWAFYSAKAQYHHQQKEGQKHTAEIREPVGVQRCAEAFGHRQHKVTEIAD